VKELPRNYRWILTLALMCAAGLFSKPAFGASPSARKRSRSDRNIDAIGHRKIAYISPNWYPIDKEKEMGETQSAILEQAPALLSDDGTIAYLERLAQAIAHNSDAQIPITIRIIDSAEAYEITLPGGYQYITRGLLLSVQNEGELASALARGIAHTALRSAMSEFITAKLMHAATISPIFVGQDAPISTTSDSGSAVPLTLRRMKRKEELDADYFGVQYLYRAGYDPACFIHFVQTAWAKDGASGSPTANAFSPFPRLPDRLKGLETEVGEILPKRDGAVATTPEFKEFHEHLRSLTPVKSEPKSQPKLNRVD